MRSPWIFAGAVAGLTIAAAWAGAQRLDEAARPPAARPGALLPRPPRQDEPWTPPESGFPAWAVDAARALFEQGLADPRGCAYREVVLAGGTWPFRDDAAPQPPTHAWVLPFDATGGRRYAVGWNGLVYPVTRLGPAADVDADVQALIRPPAAAGKPPTWPRLDSWAMRFGGAQHHLVTASESGLEPTKAILLLRLGRGDLAAAIWTTGLGPVEAANGDGAAAGRLLYTKLAADWAWALYDRAAGGMPPATIRSRWPRSASWPASGR